MARRKREARITTIKLLIAVLASVAVAWASGEPIARDSGESQAVVAAKRTHS